VAAGDLTSLSNVRSFLRIPTDQTDADTLLTALVSQASRAIHVHTGREFAALNTGSQERIFAYHGGGRLFFTPYDLRVATSVVIDTDGSTPTQLAAGIDYVLFPRNATNGVYEYMELRGLEPARRTSADVVTPWREVSITGLWGFESVPVDVVTAANMLVAFWYRQHSALSGVDLSGEGDRFGPVNMPTGVLQLLAPYRVIGFGWGA
jgi:hypothetical protein